MAHTILEFENKNNENHRRYIDIPVGFSWTALFFTGYTCLYRRQILLFMVYTILYYVMLMYLAIPVSALLAALLDIYTDSIYLLGFAVSFVATKLIIASIFNCFFVYLVKQDGFKLINVRSATKGKKIKRTLAYYKKQYNL